VNSTKEQVMAKQGKFVCWKIELANDIAYEVRKADEVYERCDNEREALEAMRVLDCIEVQNRSSDIGM
jgi:hypothetical protein